MPIALPTARKLRITGVPVPVTVYDTFSADVEALLADNWISVFDVWELRAPSSLMSACEVYWQFLYGKPLGAKWKSTPHSFWTRAQALNLGLETVPGETVIGQLTGAAGKLATQPIKGNRFDHWLRAGVELRIGATPFSVSSATGQAALQRIARRYFTQIGAESSIAPDDKQFLKALILIKMTRDPLQAVVAWNGMVPSSGQLNAWVSGLLRIKPDHLRALSNWAFSSLPLLGTPSEAIPRALLY